MYGQMYAVGTMRYLSESSEENSESRDHLVVHGIILCSDTSVPRVECELEIVDNFPHSLDGLQG